LAAVRGWGVHSAPLALPVDLGLAWAFDETLDEAEVLEVGA